jgi:general secretion pathway protein D
MLLNLIKKISILLLCSTMLLAACSTSPQRSPPSAIQLANSQSVIPVASQTSVNLPILSTQDQAQPLKEVNQKGQLPTVTTTTEPGIDTSGLKLSSKATITFDYEQVPLRLVIEDIAGSLGLSLVIDPSINDKVTVHTSPNKPLKKKDLWPLLQLLLNEAGISMEKRGGVYHLKKAPSQLPGTIGMTPKTLIQSGSPEVLQITPLRYISSETAKTIINPLIQPKGRVLSLSTLNIIGIITTPQRLKRVNKLLSVVDANPFLHRGMRLFRLINSKATEVEVELMKILKAIYGASPPTYQVVALERINAILVIAPPNSGFNEVGLWIEIIDERSGESGEQVFIYKVQNLEASKLAATLSSVFKLDQKAAEDRDRRQANQARKSPISPRTSPVVPPSKQNTNKARAVSAVSAELKVTIVADESTNSLLIRAQPRDYRQLLETIYALDQVPKEVRINVVIAEVTLTEATKFGIDWQYFFGGNNSSRVQMNLNVPSSAPGTLDKSLTGFVLQRITGSINAILNMIASSNDISILSRPSILVRNNEEASINVGSNEPFLSGSTIIGGGGGTTQDVQYKDTGITVKVTPRINDDGFINLKFYQELSQLGPERTTQNLQSFIQRKIETSIVVRDGSAIIIGGLIETRKKNAQQGIPVLKDIPLIGSVFSSIDQQDTRTELVLIIIPRIVNHAIDNRPMVQNLRQRMHLISKLLNEEQVFRQELAMPKPSQKNGNKRSKAGTKSK